MFYFLFVNVLLFIGTLGGHGGTLILMQFPELWQKGAQHMQCTCALVGFTTSDDTSEQTKRLMTHLETYMEVLKESDGGIQFPNKYVPVTHQVLTDPKLAGDWKYMSKEMGFIGAGGNRGVHPLCVRITVKGSRGKEKFYAFDKRKADDIESIFLMKPLTWGRVHCKEK